MYYVFSRSLRSRENTHGTWNRTAISCFSGFWFSRVPFNGVRCCERRIPHVCVRAERGNPILAPSDVHRVAGRSTSNRCLPHSATVTTLNMSERPVRWNSQHNNVSTIHPPVWWFCFLRDGKPKEIAWYDENGKRMAAGTHLHCCNPSAPVYL